MNDDILMDLTEYQELKEDPVISEDIENIIKEENKIDEGLKDESKQDNKSDDVIYYSADINNLRGTKSIGVSDFDVTTIWQNSNPSSLQGAGTLALIGDLSDYDYIEFIFVGNPNDYESSVIYSYDEFKRYTNNDYTFKASSLYRHTSTNSQYVRGVYYLDDNNIKIDSARNITNGGTTSTYNKVLKVNGLKLKEVQNNNPSNPEITTSGNIINNYYNNYYGVSENSVSWNIMNKPLNEYTVTESYFAISLLLALCIGIYLVIRRAIFKWR